jgi:transcriptional regulator with XRE-family HTH domain
MMPVSLEVLCKDREISLLSLAERSGIALKRLQAIYLGRWTPSPQERETIAQALETPSGDITWEHNTPVEHFYGPG